MPRHPSKGPGHGGPAKGFISKPPRGGQSTAGERVAFEPGNVFAEAENRTGGSTYRRLVKEERIGLLTEMAFNLAVNTAQDGVKQGMVQYLMNREMGTPVAKQELTGKDGGPLTHEEVSAVDRLKSRIDGLASRNGTPGAIGGSDRS